MRTLNTLGAALLWTTALSATALSTASANDLSSGLPAGESVGAFQVTKIGGIDDGVQAGTQLCYR